MKVVQPSFEIIDELDYEKVLKKIELCGRLCYKSEDKIKEGSAEKFIRGIIKSGHDSVIEHFSFSVRFICDRGITHEIVRHRVASYSQESTRYCSYDGEKFGNEITVICPSHVLDSIDKSGDIFSSETFNSWHQACRFSEMKYFEMLSLGETPQIARAVLPTCLKTEIIMTANLREWRHFLRLRADSKAHPQIVELAKPLLDELIKKLPVFFEDLRR